jgi:hypothetical protein
MHLKSLSLGFNEKDNISLYHRLVGAYEIGNVPWEDALFPIRLYIYGTDGMHGDPILILSEAQLNHLGTMIVIRSAVDSGVEVIMTDPGDLCVFHAKDRKILFPEPKEKA